MKLYSFRVQFPAKLKQLYLPDASVSLPSHMKEHVIVC
jgi:hypothetical protein